MTQEQRLIHRIDSALATAIKIKKELKERGGESSPELAKIEELLDTLSDAADLADMMA